MLRTQVRPLSFNTGVSTIDKKATFKALMGDSSTSNLTDVLTVNGISISPDIRIDGAGATTSVWTPTIGTSLPIASTGTLPTVGIDTPLTSNESAVAFSAGQVYQSTSTTFCDITTEDVAFEFIFNQKTIEQSKYLIAKKGTAGAGWGFQVYSGASRAAFLVTDAAAGTLVLNTATNIAMGWNIVHVFVDRNEASTNGAAIYINGILLTSINPNTATGSWSNTKALTIGSDSDFAAKATQDIAFCQMWKSSNWFAGGATNLTQWLAIARDRSAQLFGIYPQFAAGTAIPSWTRAAVATSDKIDVSTGIRTIFSIGRSWIRMCRRKEKVGTRYLTGVLIELQKTNLLLQSEDFTNASWNKTATAISSNSNMAPDGLITMDGIVADGTTGTHGVNQVSTLTATTYVFSAWAKAGNKNFLYLDNNTIGAGAWFNLLTGAIGTIQAGISEAQIESWGNGIYRCSIRFTGTAAAHTLRLSTADSDNVLNSSGNSTTINTYIWGAQVEATDLMGSYISTTTATTTRVLDVLSYTGGDGNITPSTSTTLQVDILSPNYDQTTVIIPFLAGGTTTVLSPNGFRIQSTTADALTGEYTAATVAQMLTTGVSNATDGEKHTLKTTYDTNIGKLYFDGVQDGATDTSLTLFATAPVAIGIMASAGSNVLVGNILVYNRVI